MPNRLQISIKILKDITTDLLSKISKSRKETQDIVREVNRKKDEEKIKNIKSKLGI
ncbi:MAG: hypothetical protein ACKOW9_06060 [Candidatus Paceibacterota bacterium]